MRGSIMRSLLKGIHRYKNVSHCRTIQGSSSAGIRSFRMAHSMTQVQEFSNADEREELMAVWPDLVTELTERLYTDIPESTKWMAEVLNYNVPCSNKHRGLSVVYAYRMLAPPDRLTDENLRLARILAWCYEIHEAFLLMQDDIIDRSTTRRNQPCWYLRDNVGLGAINDSMILEHAGNQLLETYFGKHECYVHLLETISKATLKVALGIVMDLSSSNYPNKPKLNLFSMDRYRLFTRYSGNHYFYQFPVNLAMRFAGINDPEVYKQTEPIFIDLGHLYIVKNDFLDFYGDANVTGKTGTDVQRGKCTWLTVTALEHANPSQKKILQECYGQDDPEKIALVRQVCDELDLPTKYNNYMEKVRKQMKNRINQMTCDFPKELFDVLSVIDQN